MPSEAALNTTLGPFLLGYTAVAILFGITNVQAFMYCMHSWKRDTWKLRSFVLLLWFIDALQMALTAHCVYYYLILKFGDLENLVTEPVVWSLTALLIVTDIGDFLVRAFYCQRLWKLDNNFRVLAIVANIISLFSFACGIAFTMTHRRLGPASADAAWVAYMNTSAIVFSDAVIAGGLCYRLASKAGLSDFAKTKDLVSKLISYVVGTSMLTSICAALTLITFAARPHTFIFIAFFLLLSKLYFNAMLANLNSRTKLRESTTGDDDVMLSIPLSITERGRTNDALHALSHSQTGSMTKNTTMQVHMEIDRVQAYDPKTRSTGSVSDSV